MRTLLLILAILVVASSAAIADDSYIGSAGGNLFQEKADSIQMVRERVYITLRQDTCHVACRFWFYNHSRRPQWATVGFPDFEMSMANDTKPLMNFTCSVGGQPEKEIHYTTQRTVMGTFENMLPDGRAFVDTAEEIRHWFTWSVMFRPQETTVIDNEYDGAWGGTVCERAFVYVLGTACTWMGPIRDGRITFDHTALASTQFVLRSPQRAVLTPVFYEDSTVYTFHNYLPRSDEEVDVWLHSYWDYEDSLPDLECPGFYGQVESADQARMMRNEIYARHGYVFKDAELRARFERASWYRPNIGFRTEMLSKKEAAFVARLLKKEEELRAAGGVKQNGSH